jgi:hypothetical protein
VLDRANRRRPSPAHQREVLAAYRLGYMEGINAAADGWTSTYHQAYLRETGILRRADNR